MRSASVVLVAAVALSCSGLVEPELYGLYTLTRFGDRPLPADFGPRPPPPSVDRFETPCRLVVTRGELDIASDRFAFYYDVDDSCSGNRFISVYVRGWFQRSGPDLTFSSDYRSGIQFPGAVAGEEVRIQFDGVWMTFR